MTKVAKKPKEMFGSVSVPVKTDDLRSLIISALEGGSNYWIESYETQMNPKMKKEFLPGGKFYNKDYPMEGNLVRYLLPFIPKAGGIAITVNEEGEGDDDLWEDGKSKVFVLDWLSVTNGLNHFATDEDYRHHFANFLSEDADATTGDVFLQWCLFGKQIFG